MNERTIFITFGNHQVAICSNIVELVSRLERNFEAMFTPDSTRSTVAQFEIWEKGGKYYVLENGATRLKSISLGAIVRFIRDETALRLIEAHPDLLWLHASAAAYHDSAVIIAGASGRGKSTLVTNLCAGGWSYLSDDIIPLDTSSNRLIPFPETPMVRNSQGQELSSDQLGKLRKNRVNIKPEMVCRDALPICALILPAFDFHAPTKLLPCSPATATLELLQNSLNFVNHRETAVGYLCELMKYVPAFQLPYSDGNLAAKLLTEAYENGQLFHQFIPQTIQQHTSHDVSIKT